MSKAIKNEVLEAADKGIFLIDDKLPKDASKLRDRKKLVEALEETAKALHQLEHWSEVATIRANDYTGDTMKIVVGNDAENKPLTNFISALAKGEKPDLKALSTWLDSQRERSA